MVLPNHETITINVADPAKMTIGDLKKEVVAKSNAPISNLSKGGNLMDNTKTITDLNIATGSTLDANMALPGGCAVDCCGVGCSCVIL